MKPQEAKFYQQAERFIDRLLEEAPVAATQLGDHRFDDHLADYSQAAQERQEREVRQALAEFERFDPKGFGVDARIDHRLMVQIAKAIFREFEKFRGYLRNPGLYSDECLGGVFLLLIREFAPLEDRLEKALGSLKGCPGGAGPREGEPHPGGGPSSLE
jgi:hypothetical protein